MGMTASQITRLLKAWSNGDTEAFAQLLPLVTEDLRAAALHYLQGESHPPTQPTGLVNEVCMRLLGWPKVSWENRKQFFYFAGKVMRRILVDHARARRAAKRGDGIRMITLSRARKDAAAAPEHDPETLIDLDGALNRLAEFDPRARTIVELRFFVGLTSAEIAQALGIARSTVTRDLKMARSWLAQELGKQPPLE